MNTVNQIMLGLAFVFSLGALWLSYCFYIGLRYVEKRLTEQLQQVRELRDQLEILIHPPTKKDRPSRGIGSC